MCEVMEKYENMAIKKNNIIKIKKLIINGVDKDVILNSDFTEEEYEEAEKELLQLV